MTTTETSRPVRVLIAADPNHPVARQLEAQGHAVVHAPTGALALQLARGMDADLVILDSDLPDLSWVDACQVLQGDLRLSHSVPILVMAREKPTPEQRVTALRVGVWDFVVYPPVPRDLPLKLATYAHAKRNMDVAFAEGLVDPVTGLHSGPALARRARDLAAVMARQHAGLACVVFALHGPSEPETGSLLAQAVRTSDLVGALGRSELAVVAPATSEIGAVRLAQRVAPLLRERIRSGPSGAVAAALALRVGYEVVANLRYEPVDPTELLAHASTAVRMGKPDSAAPWVRRFETEGRTIGIGSHEHDWRGIGV